MEKDKAANMNFMKKHLDAIIVGGIVLGGFWNMNEKIYNQNEKFNTSIASIEKNINAIEKDISIIKTVMVMKNICTDTTLASQEEIKK
jgi:hypothetical protein